LKSSLDLLDSLSALFGLVVGKLKEILSQADLFLLYSLKKSFSQLSWLVGDELLLHVFDFVCNLAVPNRKFVQKIFDIANSVVIGSEFFKVECLIKFIYSFTSFEFINVGLKKFKILDDLSLDLIFCNSNWSTFLFDNGSEPWTFFTDQSVDELMEISMVDDSNNFFCNSLHIT
jgi:hypothetical protein